MGGVVVGDVLDHISQEGDIVWQQAFFDIVAKDSGGMTEVIVTGVAQEERESVSMPTKRESRPN